MNAEQMKVIVSLFTGLEMAVVHLANAMAEHKPEAKEALAASFDATADLVPDPMVAMPLRHIAKGVRESSTQAAKQAAADVLDRLQRGSAPPPADGDR